MKEVVIFDKPTEYYFMLMFYPSIEEKIVLVCFENRIDDKNKTRKLSLLAECLGYKLVKTDIKKEYVTQSEKHLDKVVIYELEMTDFIKKRNKDLNNNPHNQLVKKTRYNEMGKMIFIKRYILKKLTELSVPTREKPIEDKNDIIERIIEENKSKNG